MTISIAIAKSENVLARVPDASAFLFAEETRRLQAYGHEQAARNFVAGRVLVRSLLQKLTGCPASEMRFHIGPSRKPELQDLRPWHFNLSHKHAWVAAVVATRPVGIDIETAEGVDWRRVARRMFQPAEAERLAALPDPEGRLAFCRSWSYKETLIKALAQDIDPLPELPPESAASWRAAQAPHQHTFFRALTTQDGAGHVAIATPCPDDAPRVLSLEDVMG